MSLTFGFFNSKGGDRKYNAEQMSSLFAGIIRDGVFKDYPAAGNQLKVTGVASTALKVNVGPGRAWFKNVWVNNDAPVQLTVSRHATSAKISAVVLEIRKSDTGDYNRSARLLIVDGSNGSAPTMVQDDTNEIYQYMLAYLNVPPLSDTGWNGIYSENDSKIHNRVGVSNGIPYAVVPVDAVINNRISSDLANYLNDDGSALYTFLSGKFDAVNAIISNLTGNFKKLFFFHERENDSSSNYYGKLADKGQTAIIRSTNATDGGMTNSFRPGQATVTTGDVVIGSTGKVGHIMSVVRNQSTNYLQEVTILTVGSIWEDKHYTASILYFIERAQSSTDEYYGQLNSANNGLATIRSKNSNGGMSGAWWPSAHYVAVGDAVIGSSGKIGYVTEVTRTSGGKLSTVTVQTIGNLLEQVIERLSALEDFTSQFEEDLAELDSKIDKNKWLSVYYSEQPESGSSAYYGQLNPTNYESAVIYSRDTNEGGMSGAWWPVSHTIQVNDFVIGSSGRVGYITALERASSGKLLTVTVRTIGDLKAGTRDHETRIGNLENWYTEMDGLGIGTRLTALETWKLRAVPVFVVHLHIDPILGNNNYTTVESFDAIEEAYSSGRAIVFRLDPTGDSRIPASGNNVSETYDLVNVHAVSDANGLWIIRGAYFDEDRRGSTNVADWYWLQIYAIIQSNAVHVFVDTSPSASSTNTIHGLGA